ncbi:TatD family hydrolase [Mesonia sp. K7]|uniref:TatD family hydrolase n=1 Tax=Mesonia sp. K7 TaxID=2218606 RepID=UPI000DA9FD94|nr:TatD family hydrolase [Mesonia sp. K7]PZD78423.1 hydrolase TatD [Mesonia sp. K7]
MILIDTHTHLYSDAFDVDIDEVIQKAFDADVKKFFLPAIDSETTQKMYDLEQKYPKNVHLMMGLHPTSVKENFEDELQHVETQFSQREFIAVGEIGIDLYWDKSTLGIQEEAFRRQIQFAKAKKLPIVIHCRDAFDEIFEVLETEKDDDLLGVFHCFTGNKQQAEQAISYNMKLGIGGVVTFKNGKIDQFLHEFDLSNFVLETDSPYLAPVPFRGKRNESSYTRLVAEKMAEIFGVSVEKIAEETTKNALEVFKINTNE